MTNDTAKYRFDKSLTDLQAQLKVLPIGVAAAGAWNYSFIYDIVARYYPDLSNQARPIIGAVAGAMTIARWRVVGLVIATFWVGAIRCGFAYDALLAARLF